MITLKKFLLVVIATTCMPLIAEQCTTSHPTCDSRAQLAMEYIHSMFGDEDSALSVWIADDYGISGRTHIERRKNLLEKLAKWANGLNVEDRRAYLSIIDSYEDGEKEAYAEWRTHKLQRTQAAFDKHLRECAEAARKSADHRALPKPPETLFEEDHAGK
jgi:hypothetical protein